MTPPEIVTCSYRAWRPGLGAPVVTSLTTPKTMPEAATWPRLWAATPSWEYFRSSAREFDAAYLAQLRDEGPGRIAARLAEIAASGFAAPVSQLALLCWEADPARCHRATFARWWLAETGQTIAEAGREGAARCLSVRPEWAWAIMYAGKLVENRSWSTRFRGRLLIHASLRPDPAAREFMAARGIQVPGDLPRGAIAGAVTLADVVTDSTSPWAEPGQKHWLLTDPEPWPEPIAAKGDLGLWEWHPASTNRPATRPAPTEKEHHMATATTRTRRTRKQDAEQPAPQPAVQVTPDVEPVQVTYYRARLRVSTTQPDGSETVEFTDCKHQRYMHETEAAARRCAQQLAARHGAETV